ncbi:Glucose dehydrogenase [FAD, quinone] [Gryllus bimaculatus]|nr:Glucose dehydrogenase [FAD, quinone] [Gryllus bimaculatus]
MGGSTVTNAMMYVRGHPADYDEWERLGNAGWGYRHVLPYFRKSENVQIPELRSSPFHGTEGPLPVSYSPFASRLSDLFLEAAREKGIPQVDYNGQSQMGVSRIQTTTWRGERWSTNRAFLFPTKRRRNLFVRKRALVTRVLLDAAARRAVGVRYERDGASHVATARREVVLCAGAINTPQLLMLSGVGPSHHLRDMGIPVRKDLPVGQNLVDHTMFFGLALLFNESVAPSENVFHELENYVDYFSKRQGPLSNIEFLEMVYYFQAGRPIFDSAPNMEMYMFDYPPVVNYDNSNVNIYQNLTGKHSSLPVLVPLRPASKGNVTLASTDIHVQPKIFPNFFGEEEDVKNAVEGLKKMLELFQTQAFQKVGTKLFDEKLPTCENHEFASDDYWACVLKRFSLTSFHPCCTCRMGPKDDVSSVVDPDLRVKGIFNLRVADASVFPTMVSGHLQAPAQMVAEKAAEMILNSH